tara:strand:+ start:2351 stop:2752 length:402 start_codon:yes stop_codon:yes gene_type:complete
MKIYDRFICFAILYKAAIHRLGVLALILSYPLQAQAATFSLSKIIDGMTDEAVSVAPSVLLFFTLAGIVVAGWSLLSAWSCKKNNQPLTWQLFGLCIGGLTSVLLIVIMSFAGTLSGGQSSGDDSLNQLNLTY